MSTNTRERAAVNRVPRGNLLHCRIYKSVVFNDGAVTFLGIQIQCT